MAVKLGAVHAGKLGLAADGQTAAAAHAGGVDHDRAERADGLDAVGLGGKSGELHHLQRPDDEHFVIFAAGLDELFQLGVAEALLAVAAVVGADVEVGGVGAHLVLQDHDVLAAEAGDHIDLDPGFIEALAHGVADGAADAAADDADALLSADLGGFAHGADKVGKAVADFHQLQHTGGLADGLDHDGNGTGLAVVIGNGQGNALAVLIQTQDDELAGQALLGDQRGLDDVLKDRAGLIQGPLAYDRKHSFFPFFLPLVCFSLLAAETGNSPPYCHIMRLYHNIRRMEHFFSISITGQSYPFSILSAGADGFLPGSKKCLHSSARFAIILVAPCISEYSASGQPTKR